MTAVDVYAHNPVAEQNRDEKARAIAQWCWDNKMNPGALSDAQWRAVARAAGTRPPGEYTRPVVLERYAQLAGSYAPPAVRPAQGPEHSQWPVPLDVFLERARTNLSELGADAFTPVGARVDAPARDADPWLESATDVPCSLWEPNRDSYCGEFPTRRYVTGQRCRRHTPTAQAGRKEQFPDPAHTLPALLERSGRKQIGTSLLASQLVDDRAILAGKSSRGAHAYREALATAGAHRAPTVDLRSPAPTSAP